MGKTFHNKVGLVLIRKIFFVLQEVIEVADPAKNITFLRERGNWILKKKKCECCNSGRIIQY